MAIAENSNEIGSTCQHNHGYQSMNFFRDNDRCSGIIVLVCYIFCEFIIFSEDSGTLLKQVIDLTVKVL